MIKGELIYKNKKSRLSIYKNNNELIIIKGNHTLRTFNISKVQSELEFENKGLFTVFGILVFYIILSSMIIFRQYEPGCQLNEIVKFSLWSILICGLAIYLLKLFMPGRMKLKSGDDLDLRISKREFEEISAIINTL